MACSVRSGWASLPLIDPDLFLSKIFRIGITQQGLQQIALGGAMIALPIYLQMVLEYNALQAGLSLAPLSLSMFAVAILAGAEGRRSPPQQHRPGRLRICSSRHAALLPLVPRADSGLWLAIPLLIAGSGLGLLVSQLNNYTLAPISEERISEAAGVNSAAGSFGLSFGLALAGALMMATLAVLLHQHGRRERGPRPGGAAAGRHRARRRRPGHEQHPARRATGRVSRPMSRPRSSASTPRPGHIALQVALLVPLLAGLFGLVNSFRMMRLPDVAPSAAVEGLVLG